MELDAVPLHRGYQRAGEFGIEERQQDIATVDENHLRTKCVECAGIFAADHPGSHDRHGLRQPVQTENGVGIVDPPAAEWKYRRPNRRGSSRNQEIASVQGQFISSRYLTDSNRVRIDEGTGSTIDVGP